MDIGASAVQPLFIDGTAGRLFALYHPPTSEHRDGCDVIYVPPFAEEMNRSRRMAALQARALAAAGVGVLALDLFGTGDSAGDFGEARWEIWREDVAAAGDWLVARNGRPLALWGLRLGALLAAEVAARQPDRFRRLVLWQPVAEGKTMLTQFLRVQLATAMAAGGNRETTESLRATLAAGRPVEIAGYELAPELAAAIDAARCAACALSPASTVDWFEVSPSGEAVPSPVAQRAIDAWRAAGVTVETAAVAGQQFWSVQETVIAPQLLDVTRRVFEGA